MAELVNHRVHEAGLARRRHAVEGIVPVGLFVDHHLDVRAAVVEAAIAKLRGETARHGATVDLEKIYWTGRGQQGALRVVRRLHRRLDHDRHGALNHLGPRGDRCLKREFARGPSGSVIKPRARSVGVDDGEREAGGGLDGGVRVADHQRPADRPRLRPLNFRRAQPRALGAQGAFGVAGDGHAVHRHAIAVRGQVDAVALGSGQAGGRPGPQQPCAGAGEQ